MNSDAAPFKVVMKNGQLVLMVLEQECLCSSGWDWKHFMELDPPNEGNCLLRAKKGTSPASRFWSRFEKSIFYYADLQNLERFVNICKENLKTGEYKCHEYKRS